MATIKLKQLKNVLLNGTIKTLPADAFIKRLRSLVIGEGMLHEGNIYLMNLAIEQMPVNGVVLEIGSYGGLSTNLMLHLLKKLNRQEKLLTCDPWIYEGYADENGEDSEYIDGRTDITRVQYSDYMKQNFINGVKFLNPSRLPYSFQITSDKFFELYEEKRNTIDIFGKQITLGFPISFAYIDGNHAYEYVKNDFKNVDKYLRKNGFILFDDSMDEMQFGSAKFMQEMMQHPNYKLVDKNPNYLFQKVK